MPSAYSHRMNLPTAPTKASSKLTFTAFLKLFAADRAVEWRFTLHQTKSCLDSRDSSIMYPKYHT